MIDSAVKARLEALGHEDLGPFLQAALDDNPDAEAAQTNLERWLHSTGNARLYLEQLVLQPEGARRLCFLFGAVQHMADLLIQNPELGTIVLDPAEATRVPVAAKLLSEGRRLLAAATGQRHALDRLRFLKQRYLLPIVLSDLMEEWPQETVWRALSDLADALIQLALEVLWPQFASARSLGPEIPIAIVAFGKLGAGELNYSSDVDLVYVLRDGLDERVERECSRFCEQFGRAISDRMGRGSLYRVDLRLRPYGTAGPILRTFDSMAGYYRLYAEAWETQALLKSRVVAGADLAEPWEALKTERVYPPHVSEVFVHEMLAMRRRLEEFSTEDDLKRGAGGIRDVEFLCQILQIANGHAKPEVRAPATCDALRALEEEQILEPNVARALLEGYTFLRKLEHRAQMAGDRQTHQIPQCPAARQKLAHLMGVTSWPDLSNRLRFQRRTIQTLYQSILRREPDQESDRDALAERLGPKAPTLLHWFDVLPEAEAYYRSLAENEGSLGRVLDVVEEAPRLVTSFKNSLELTELLMSGEIEEDQDPTHRLADLDPTATPRRVADALDSAVIATCTRWILNQSFNLNATLSGIYDALLRHCVLRLQGRLDIVALGSYGCLESGPGSDLDLLLITDRGQAGAEHAAQELIHFLNELKRYGPSLTVDLRLRPEGKKGLLVRSYDGFGAYEVSAMEMWERFALGHARLVSGQEEAMDLIRHAAYAVPLTPERLEELLAMKRRIETERVKPQHLERDIKLGHGGLNDIEWTVHLLEMRYPTATGAADGRCESTALDARIRCCGRASLLNTLEVDSLLEAHRYLLDLRNRLYLLDIRNDLVPENPDKLARLANVSGLADSNEFLRRHQSVAQWTRRLFVEVVERLRK